MTVFCDHCESLLMADKQLSLDETERQLRIQLRTHRRGPVAVGFGHTAGRYARQLTGAQNFAIELPESNRSPIPGNAHIACLRFSPLLTFSLAKPPQCRPFSNIAPAFFISSMTLIHCPTQRLARSKPCLTAIFMRFRTAANNNGCYRSVSSGTPHPSIFFMKKDSRVCYKPNGLQTGKKPYSKPKFQFIKQSLILKFWSSSS